MENSISKAVGGTRGRPLAGEKSAAGKLTGFLASLGMTDL